MAKGGAAGPLFFELNNGIRIPSVGLGTWQADPGVVGDVIVAAVKAGYRHIDCARLYENEKEIGMALKKLFTEGVIKREDMWITSKLWCTDHAPEDVPVAMDRTLQDLQLDYVDLYLVHWPFRMEKGTTSASEFQKFCPVDIHSTWRAMEKLYESGRAHAIGVSNFSSKKLGDLLKYANITPAVNQVECHPIWQQAHLRSFCETKGIHLSAHTPLGSRGTSWVKTDILKNPTVCVVAEKLCKTPAQVSLRWGLQNGMSVLPKSTNESRMKENIDIFNWSIPHDLFLKFSKIEQRRLIPGDFTVHETLSPYRNLEELWDGEI